MNATQILVDLALAVIPLAIPALSAVAVQWLRSHVSANRLSIAASVAGEAVNAAEQIGAQQGWTGPTKKAQALAMASSLLSRHGVNIPTADLATLVESAVADLHAAGQDLTTSAPAPAPVAPVTTPSPPPMPAGRGAATTTTAP